MRDSEVSKLEHGIYRVWWTTGGSSVAAVGSTYNGKRWLAPANWTSPHRRNPHVASTAKWALVRKVRLIEVQRIGLPIEKRRSSPVEGPYGR